MAKRKQRPQEEPRELTRKEHRVRARDRERRNRILVGTGIALAVALLLVLAGLISEFIVRPNSVVATVGETQLVTRAFWKRTFLEQNRLQNQLIRLTQMEQQFGNQGFFTQQINQLQGILSSPFTLGVEVLDQMIREEVIMREAEARGITVTDEEIDEALREEVAGQQGAVTVPQATATAEAQAAATVTAESWTPTPTATVDASGVVTATATPIPTPPPPPTSTILTDEAYATGLEELENNLREIANMTMAEYREIVRVRLLDEKLGEVIGEEQVAATEEQVHARHILIDVSEPVSPTSEITSTSEITTSEVATGAEVTATEAVTAAEGVTTTEEAAATEAVTATEGVTESQGARPLVPVEPATDEAATESEPEDARPLIPVENAATETITDSAAITDTATVTGTVEGESGEDAATDEPLDEAAALALALELRQRILNGEDFATLAAEYSSDGSAASGDDLGWFGRGRMVAPFEEAAFSLEPGEISEPIRTDFGYHLIEVLEKDAERPKDEATLEQERATAYNTWLEEQIAATPVERGDIVSKLPRNLDPIVPQVAPAAATPAAPAAPATQ